MFVGIVTSIMTMVLVSSLGFGFRAYELGNRQEVRLAVIETYIKNQDKLNEKLTRLLESGGLNERLEKANRLLDARKNSQDDGHSI